MRRAARVRRRLVSDRQQQPASARYPAALKAGIARLRKATAEAGRDPASVGVSYRVKRYGEAVPANASDGERRLFSGSEADIIGDLRALRDMGVAALDIDFERSDPEDSVAEMRRFKEQVISRL